MLYLLVLILNFQVGFVLFLIFLQQSSLQKQSSIQTQPLLFLFFFFKANFSSFLPLIAAEVFCSSCSSYYCFFAASAAWRIDCVI
jgi:hypothetical protein